VTDSVTETAAAVVDPPATRPASTVRARRGVCVWFTGLSGSGKTTTAVELVSLIRQHGREVTVLDGDVVRTHLSRGLGFSREDRDTNVRRIGFVATEVVRHGGIVVAAVVSPYRSTRDEVRLMVGEGNFVEVFVDTPLEVCEQRDVKGWYAKVRAGEVESFTGVDDPYEAPLRPELVLYTTDTTPAENARRVIAYLQSRGDLPSS
jgi:sulfate adenylyltransferase